MKVTATLKNLRIAPRKVRLVAHSVVGVDAQEALRQLEKQVKKSSLPMRVLLQSAIANATHNFGLLEDNLYVHEVRVGDGLRLKRFIPKAFGRAAPMLRRGSHVEMILEEKIPGKKGSSIQTSKKKKETLVHSPTESQTHTHSKEEKSSITLPSSLSKHPEKSVGTPRVGDKKAGGKFTKKIFQRKASH